MKVFLLYPDRDFDPSRPLPPQSQDLIQDLGLEILFRAMARGDEFLLQVAQQVVLSGEQDIATIRYRQAILKDCIRHPEVVREIYQIPLEFLERKRKQWLWISPRHSSPTSILNGARQLLEASLDLMHRLRQIADSHVGDFASDGFRRFFTMIQKELDDEYLQQAAQHVQRLRFSSGVPLGARLGRGNEGTDYVLCKPHDTDQNWFHHLFSRRSPSYSYRLHPRDDAGARALGELRDRGLARTAIVVAQAAEHVESFLNVLRWELAFYMGCLNLYERLTQLGEPVAFPEPAPADAVQFSAVGLYDVTLALTVDRRVVGNDISASGKPLVLITGPNQGGKTTFLRSVGLAQLMMQSGMFVPAERFSSSVCAGLFTHFKREEDKTMESGKFEEELRRMSRIVDHLSPHAMLLCNESFAATNEREGSEIAWQITRSLLEHDIRIFYVTHLYEYARRCYESERERCRFLRAERLPDGTRTFKVREDKPIETSYGADLYYRIFGVEKIPAVSVLP